MKPSSLYSQQIESGLIEDNPQQRQVLRVLDQTFDGLIERQAIRNSLPGKLRRKIKPRLPIHGLYCYGGVGIGKTHLMDLFYQSLPVKKMRLHFHVFMRELHEQLKRAQGQVDPLKNIAKKIADDHLVICFDEFFISNITDAMLLGELFKFLFSGGVCLVTTSNIAPDDLYRDGLQRERFLPTITLIKQFTTVIELVCDQDYRFRHLQKAGVYYSPLGESAERNLALSFEHFRDNAVMSSDAISLYGRTIPIVKQAGAVIWFDFAVICQVPRSQNDYLSLAEHYDTVIVSHIPRLHKTQTNEVILFIKLVDVLYDHGVRLVVSAEVPVEELYTEGRMTFEFERTKSRLIEMNSVAYFSGNLQLQCNDDSLD